MKNRIWYQPCAQILERKRGAFVASWEKHREEISSRPGKAIAFLLLPGVELFDVDNEVRQKLSTPDLDGLGKFVRPV
jgi:hypothetical protein